MALSEIREEANQSIVLRQPISEAAMAVGPSVHSVGLCGGKGSVIESVDAVRADGLQVKLHTVC